MIASTGDGQGALDLWMAGVSGGGERERPGEAAHGVRFALHGCVGGADPEGPEVSEAWRREMAEHAIAGQGVIVTAFLDVEVTSRASWAVRPRASALLAASGEPDRGFDAVVVGDYERAFGTVSEFKELVLLFERRGVRVWMHEAGGLVSVGGPDFPALLTVLQSVVHVPTANGVATGRHRAGRRGAWERP